MCFKGKTTFFSFLTSYFRCTPDLDWRRGRWGLSRVNIVSCLLCAWWPWHGGCMVAEQLWGDTPHPRAEKPQQNSRHWSSGCAALGRLWEDTQCQGQRRRPSKMVERVESHLKPNHIPARDRAHTLCAPGPRHPTESETELCLCIFWGGMGQQWIAAGAGALGAVDLGMA